MFGTLDIALADPRNLNLIDELSLLLNKKLRVKVATLSQIAELLKKTEQSQRVLDEATEGFTLDVIREEENGDDTISIDRLTRETDIVREESTLRLKNHKVQLGGKIGLIADRIDELLTRAEHHVDHGSRLMPM